MCVCVCEGQLQNESRGTSHFHHSYLLSYRNCEWIIRNEKWYFIGHSSLCLEYLFTYQSNMNIFFFPIAQPNMNEWMSFSIEILREKYNPFNTRLYTIGDYIYKQHFFGFCLFMWKKLCEHFVMKLYICISCIFTLNTIWISW